MSDAALKKPDSELIFKLLHLPRQRRLRDKELSRGTGDVLLVRHGDEISEYAQILASSLKGQVIRPAFSIIARSAFFSFLTNPGKNHDIAQKKICL